MARMPAEHVLMVGNPEPNALFDSFHEWGPNIIPNELCFLETLFTPFTQNLVASDHLSLGYAALLGAKMVLLMFGKPPNPRI